MLLNKNLSKKGDISTVKGLIIGLIVILVLWFIFIYIGDFLYGTGNKTACQIWVDKNSVAGLKEVFNSGENSPCVTTEEIIKKKDIKERNDLYEKIARNMYDCWDQYRQGEADFYSNFDWGLADTHCRICSEIKFDDEVKNNFKEIDVDEFEVYLSNHNPPNNKFTYADILTKTQNARIDLGSLPLNLKSGKSIYTTFLIYKKSSGLTPGTIAFTLGGCVAGAKIGAVVGTIYAPVTATTGCAIGMISVLFVKAVGTGDELHPGIVLFSSDSNNIANACDYVYYNPEQKPLQFTKKESS